MTDNANTLRLGLLSGTGALLALSLTACTTNPHSLEVNDPFEPANRAVLSFNLATDRVVIGPAARLYRDAVPAPGRKGVSNFLTNLNQPVVFTNLLLQGRFGPAFETAGRFTLNTIVGVAGVFEVAGQADIARYDTDFGLTLGRWGVDSGPYLVLPFLGPSSVRDATGRFVDRYPHPTYWVQEVRDGNGIWVVRAKTILDVRVELEETFRSLDHAAVDPYIQLRSVYRQNRASLLRDDSAYDDLPDFD